MDSQDDAPVCEALRQYKEKKYLPFTVPGHKLGRGIDEFTKNILGDEIFKNDLTISAGLDDRMESKAVRQRAENLAAEALGADCSFFSVNGSSLSMHAAMMAVADPEDIVITARNGHKSLIGASIFAGVNQVFIENYTDKALDIEYGVVPEELDDLLEKHPETEAVFLVSPTYYGVCSDVRALANVCHKHETILIVDEAWGPHFGFHPDLPDRAIKCGADLSINSIHKNLNGLGQASIINMRSDLIDRARLELAVRFFESTSPSSLIMASIDGARRYMVAEGEHVWGNVLRLSKIAKDTLQKLDGIRVLREDFLGKPGSYAFDDAKLVVEVKGLGISGFTASDWLMQEKQIMIELADNERILALLSPGDDEQSINQFYSAIKNLVEEAPRLTKKFKPLPPLTSLKTECVMSPRMAFFKPSKLVSLGSAVGEIAAETITPYPPGIPRLIPGEYITREIVDYLKMSLDAGAYIDALDNKLEQVRVVKHLKTKISE